MHLSGKPTQMSSLLTKAERLAGTDAGRCEHNNRNLGKLYEKKTIYAHVDPDRRHVLHVQIKKSKDPSVASVEKKIVVRLDRNPCLKSCEQGESSIRSRMHSPS